MDEIIYTSGLTTNNPVWNKQVLPWGKSTLEVIIDIRGFIIECWYNASIWF